MRSAGVFAVSREKVLVALSGGVDSAVAAALLIEAGYTVSAVYFRLGAARTTPAGQAALDGEAARAARIAGELGIPFTEADLREQFEKQVIGYFTVEYSRGRTPNPCTLCNRVIKFAALLQKADELSICRIATGHYARVEYCPQKERHLLKKGRDREKDQSYMLYSLTQKQLARSLFPLGELTKKKVWEKAQRLVPSAAGQRESQEICFIPGDDYRSFLKSRGVKAKPGPIVDRSGRVLGRHAGLPFYTVGQRRGLGLSSPQPLYVTEIRSADNTIVVGERSALYRRAARLEQLNLVALASLEQEERVEVKIRYRTPAVPAHLAPLERGNHARLLFDAPQPAVTPGQAAVFYRGDLLLGGGLIAAAYNPGGAGHNN